MGNSATIFILKKLLGPPQRGMLYMNDNHESPFFTFFSINNTTRYSNTLKVLTIKGKIAKQQFVKKKESVMFRETY